MQILGRISLGLLICIILGRGIWLYRVRGNGKSWIRADGRPGPERYLVGGGDFSWTGFIVLFSLAKGCGEKLINEGHWYR